MGPQIGEIFDIFVAVKDRVAAIFKEGTVELLLFHHERSGDVGAIVCRDMERGDGASVITQRALFDADGERAPSETYLSAHSQCAPRIVEMRAAQMGAIHVIWYFNFR